jgi:hypothetical protein
MILGIALTTLSGLCTMGMTIADLSDSGGHGGDINLSGIQYIFGAPFILIGALIWWGGWALGRKNRARLRRPAFEQAMMIQASRRVPHDGPWRG